MKPEVLEVKLNRYQREFLWNTLRDERWESLKESAKEFSEIYKNGVEKYVKGLPEYNLFLKYSECFRTVSQIDLPSKLVESVYNRVMSRIRSEHPDWRVQALYSLNYDLRNGLGTVARFDSGLPNLSCISLIDGPQFYDLGVFTMSEIFMLEERLDDLVWKISELDNLWTEYDSDAGNKFGKIATWGELRRANPEWFDIVYNKYADSSDVKESIKAIEEGNRIKKGKSAVLNETLAELRDLAKKCNIIK